MRKLSALKGQVEEWRRLDEQSESLDELLALALDEGDDSLQGTFDEEFETITRTLDDLEF